MEYFYLEAPENHYDLADCFGGVYDTKKQIWRFNIEQKNDVLNFLNCSGDEETDKEDIIDYLDKHIEPEKKSKRSRSIHRARSACVDRSSDSESESESTQEKTLKKQKTPNPQVCDVAKKKQLIQQQTIRELEKISK